jgi:hypothetical protein
MYLPLLALRPGVRVGETPISESTPTFIDIAQHTRDLPHALREAFIVVADSAAAKATGIVINTGGVVTTHAPHTLEVDTSAGSLYDRTKEETVVIPAKAKLALKPHNDTEDRTSLVVVDDKTGATSIVDGVLAEPGESVAPAAGEGKSPLAEVLVAAKATEATLITDVRARP